MIKKLKPKSHKFTLTEDTQFDVLGLSTAFNDYRLAWELNTCLDMRITLHEEQLEIYESKTKETSFFRVYHFFDEENLTKYYIIKNKQNFKFLLPEKSAFDYFLLIRDNFIFEMIDFTTRLRQINGIVAVFTIANSEFELAEHLTF